MKRAIVALCVLAVAVIGFFVWKHGQQTEKKPAEEQKPLEEITHVTHDEQGRVVVKIDDEAQGKMGLLVEKPAACQQSRELKAYGKVLDPTPLAGLMSELATAQAQAAASTNVLARQKLLASQDNTSQQNLQAAEANAVRDELAVQAARQKLILSWGTGIAD